jgi:hypothetical protein
MARGTSSTPHVIPGGPHYCPDEWVVHLSVHHQTSRLQYCLSHIGGFSQPHQRVDNAKRAGSQGEDEQVGWSTSDIEP